MLDALRNMMGGVIAKILIGLLVLSFAVWGVSDTFIGGSTTNTIAVGDTKVSLAEYRLAYESRINALQRQIGQRLTREQARAFGIESAVRSELVAGALLDETARKMGLGLSDERLAQTIADDPTFQDSQGNFSRQRLAFLLSQAGMREEDYIRSQKSVAVRQQLISGVIGDATMPDAFLDLLSKYEAQKRRFAYVTVTPAAIGTVDLPDEETLQAFYEDNLEDYRAPEYRAINVVRLTPEDIAAPEALDAEQVLEEYERVKDRFSAPERRRIQQITFTNRDEAERAQGQLRDGERFEDVAAGFGRSESDIDLGLLTRDQVPDATIAETAFSLTVNAVSDIIDGVFGPVLLRVIEVEAAGAPALEEIEDQIRDDLARAEAEDEIFDIHDRVEDERAAGDTLLEAARKADLEAITVSRIDARGADADGETVPGLPEAGRLLTEIFQTDPGVETDPLSLNNGGFVWYEVTEIIDERQKTFDEVRTEVEEAWLKDETAQRTAEIADSIKERVEKGEDFDEIAKEVLPPDSLGRPATVETSEPVARADSSGELVNDAVAAGFVVPEGSVITAPGAEEGQRMVLRVVEVIDDDGEQPPENVVELVNEQVRDNLLNQLIGQLQAREDVVINQRAIDTALSF